MKSTNKKFNLKQSKDAKAENVIMEILLDKKAMRKAQSAFNDLLIHGVTVVDLTSK